MVGAGGRVGELGRAARLLLTVVLEQCVRMSVCVSRWAGGPVLGGAARAL